MVDLPKTNVNILKLIESDQNVPIGKMYNSLAGIWSNAEMSVLKFFASTSFGTCASHSVSWRHRRQKRCQCTAEGKEARGGRSVIDVSPRVLR